MTYCRRHQRALVPEPYDFRRHRPLPPAWHTLSAATVARAVAWAGQLGQVIVVYIEPCDWCENESQAGTLAS